MKGGNKSLDEHLPTHNNGLGKKRKKKKRKKGTMVDGTKNDQKENKKARWRFKYINIKGKMTKKTQ